MSAPQPSSPEVGLIGLGLMGDALAERILGAGFGLHGYDLSASARDAFAARGGQAVDSANAIFTRCRVVILSLPSHDETAAVLAAGREHLLPGSILIDTTTGDPIAAAAFAAELAGRGVAYLDATISGSSKHVRSGTAVLMVGGEPAALTRVHALLARITPEVFHTGPAGTGSRMKLVTNVVLGLNRAALAEGLVLAESLGLDATQALAVMRAGPAYSRMMDTKGEKMLRRDYEPEARLSQHLKDVRLILAQAKAAGVQLPLSEAHRTVLERAEAAGFGGADNSALIEALRARGTPPLSSSP